MSGIITVLFAIITLSAMTYILVSILCKNNNKPVTQEMEDISFYNDLTSEDEIIMLLRNIAKNQKAIKINTTIIAIIMLIPIIISILILTVKIDVIIKIIDMLSNY